MVLVAISPLAMRSGGAAADERTYTVAKVFVQVGSSAILPVKTLRGGARYGVVEAQGPDEFGTRDKKLGQRVVQDDIEVTFQWPNAAFIQMLDAFLDGQRTTFDVVTTDFNGTPTLTSRAVDAQVLSVTFGAFDASSKDACNVTVVLRPGSYAPVTPSSTKIPASTDRNDCLRANFQVLVDGQTIQAVTLDSVQLQGDFIRGENRPGFDHPNIRITTSIPRGLELEKWFSATIGSSASPTPQAERTFSLVLRPPTLAPPAVLQMDATGVGIVARRHAVGSKGFAVEEFEMYVERWNRKGHLPPGTVTTTTLGLSPVPPAGEKRELAAAGTFVATTPTGPLSGTGAVCMVGGESLFVIQLTGEGGVGLITGNNTRLRPGSYPIAVEGSSTITVGFSRSGTSANSFSATGGTLTITKAGKTFSGSLTIVADGIDQSGETKGAKLTATFTDLPAHC
ncbi:MAG: hypothetical protein JWO05_2513 [Gemmatimonadetes bacterium]|nr:hypothetical protein [Gemmatimonadota bacterium]